MSQANSQLSLGADDLDCLVDPSEQQNSQTAPEAKDTAKGPAAKRQKTDAGEKTTKVEQKPAKKDAAKKKEASAEKSEEQAATQAEEGADQEEPNQKATADKTKDKDDKAEEEVELPEAEDDDDLDMGELQDLCDKSGASVQLKGMKGVKEKVPFTDEEAEQTIAEWMEHQNRPYSVQNLLDNFQHQLKRTQALKVLDDLSASGILTPKDYGKSKVYLINQDIFPATSQEQLNELDEQIKLRKEEFDKLSENLKPLSASLKEQSSGLTNEMIQEQLLDLRSKVQTLRAKIKPYKESGTKPLTEAELNKAEALLKKWGLEWKRRKRGCMDALNAIAESCDINPKEFAKKVQIETDEDLKVVCPV